MVSNDQEVIRDYIVNELHRGCSIYEMEGGFSRQKHGEVQALLTQDEFSNLMSFIKKNNIQSFITAGNVSEVYGLWNEKKRK